MVNDNVQIDEYRSAIDMEYDDRMTAVRVSYDGIVAVSENEKSMLRNLESVIHTLRMKLKDTGKYLMFDSPYSQFHGLVHVPEDVFSQLNPEYFIDGCTDTIKHMCASPAETAHLESFGIIPNVNDWYTIELE